MDKIYAAHIVHHRLEGKYNLVDRNGSVIYTDSNLFKVQKFISDNKLFPYIEGGEELDVISSNMSGILLDYPIDRHTKFVIITKHFTETPEGTKSDDEIMEFLTKEAFMQEVSNIAMKVVLNKKSSPNERFISLLYNATTCNRSKLEY